MGTWNPRRVEQRETCVLEEDDEQARQARGVANNTGDVSSKSNKL